MSIQRNRCLDMGNALSLRCIRDPFKFHRDLMDQVKPVLFKKDREKIQKDLMSLAVFPLIDPLYKIPFLV